MTHVDYPHHPGYLYDCPACETRCHCTSGHGQCVWSGHRGQWEYIRHLGPSGPIGVRGWCRVKRAMVRGTGHRDRYRVGRSMVTGLQALRDDYQGGDNGDEWGRAVGLLHSACHVLWHLSEMDWDNTSMGRAVVSHGRPGRTWDRVYTILADYRHGPMVCKWPLPESQGSTDAQWSRMISNRQITIEDLVTMAEAMDSIRAGLEGIGYGY